MLRLAHVFTDNMVLQRNKPFRVWGWSDGDVRCTLTDASGKVT